MPEFEKNEVIYSESIGVCRVTDIVNLSTKTQSCLKYYILTPVCVRSNPSYIPVYNHQVHLRHLITVEEAKVKKSLDELSELEKQEIEYVLGKEKTDTDI